MPHVDIELEDNKQFISNIPRILGVIMKGGTGGGWWGGGGALAKEGKKCVFKGILAFVYYASTVNNRRKHGVFEVFRQL